MAYNFNNLAQVSTFNAAGISKGWTYTTLVDSLGACEASGYFNPALSVDSDNTTSLISVGDSIWVSATDGNALLSVLSLAPIVTSALAGSNLLQYATVPVTLAALIAMYDAPVQLVAAPGANKLAVFKQLQLVQTYGSAALANGGVSAVQYDSTVHGAGVIASTTLSAATLFQTASSVYTYNPGVVVLPFATCVNKGLYLSCLTGDFTGGTASTFLAKVWYSVVSVV